MEWRVVNRTPSSAHLLLAALPAILCGCGGTATVTGKVTYQGRAVTYGSVIFLCPDHTARSGAILPDGSYTVAGVYPGELKVGVISRDPSKGRSVSRGGHRATKRAPLETVVTRGWFPLPARFEDPEKSGLGCALASGYVSYDIVLK
jgi:hypothetical protein